MGLRLCKVCYQDETQKRFTPRTVSVCSECNAKRNKKWRLANPERARANCKAWRDRRLLEARLAIKATEAAEATQSVSSAFWDSYEPGRGYY